MSYLEEVKKPGQTVNPLFAHLGIEILQADEAAAVLRLPFHPGTIQGAGIVAGGILATLLDEAMAHAVIPRLESGEGKHTATTNLEVRFLKPAREGDTLTVTAKVIKPGRRAMFLEAEVVNQEGITLAKGSATFLVLA